jgi:hypothetical protein
VARAVLACFATGLLILGVVMLIVAPDHAGFYGITLRIGFGLLVLWLLLPRDAGIRGWAIAALAAVMIIAGTWLPKPLIWGLIAASPVLLVIFWPTLLRLGGRNLDEPRRRRRTAAKEKDVTR